MNSNQNSTMRVKCPKCSAAYSIPSEKIGEEAQRVRCAKCGNVFAVRRRNSKAPPGYDDFSEKSSSVPDEFAFLNQAGRGESAPEQPPPQQPPPPPIPQSPPPIPAARDDKPRQAIERPASAHSAPMWEEPIDSVTDYQTGSSRLSQIVAISIAALICAFFVFVAYRSNWELSFFKLPEQIEFAFFGGAIEKLPEEVKELEVLVKNTRVVAGDEKQNFVVVTGELFNNAPGARTHVILRGRILDAQGGVRAEVRCPCGKTIEDSEIISSKRGNASSLYEVGGEIFNCTVNANSMATFTMVFDNVPADYGPSNKVEVQALSARYSKL